MPGSVTGREKGNTQRGRQMISGPSGETNDGRKTDIWTALFDENFILRN